MDIKLEDFLSTKVVTLKITDDITINLEYDLEKDIIHLNIDSPQKNNYAGRGKVKVNDNIVLRKETVDKFKDLLKDDYKYKTSIESNPPTDESLDNTDKEYESSILGGKNVTDKLTNDSNDKYASLKKAIKNTPSIMKRMAKLEKNPTFNNELKSFLQAYLQPLFDEYAKEEKKDSNDVNTQSNDLQQLIKELGTDSSESTKEESKDSVKNVEETDEVKKDEQ